VKGNTQVINSAWLLREQYQIPTTLNPKPTFCNPILHRSKPTGIPQDSHKPQLATHVGLYFEGKQKNMKGSVKEPNMFHNYETEKITRKASDAAENL